MAGNTVDIVVKVSGVAEARRQIDELTRMGLRARLGGPGGGGIGGTAGAAAAGTAPWWANPYAITAGVAALPGIVPPLGALMGLGAFGAVAMKSGAGKEGLKDLNKQFTDMANSMAPMVNKALKPVFHLFSDLLQFIKPLATAGGQILDAFVKPLDALVHTVGFSAFIAEMGKVGVQFAKLFGPAVAKMIGAILQMLTAWAPAGMRLWQALTPLVTLLVDKLAGTFGQALPPLTVGLARLLRAVMPILPPLVKILNDIVPPLAKVIGGLASVIAKGLTDAFSWAAKIINQQVLPGLELLRKGLDLEAHFIDSFVKHWKDDWGIVWTWVKQIGGDITQWIWNDFLVKIGDWFKNLGPTLGKFGKQAFTDLWDAIKTVAGNILSWAKGWVSNLLGIFSPLASIWHAITGSGSGGKSPGPSGGQPAANAALARRMMPAWSTGANWSAWNNIAMAESGWNQFATNPNSGAYGIPQALPPTKMPFAAQAAGGSQPAAQIAWMIAYMANRYGGPQQAWAFHLAHGSYDKGGWLPPGLSLAYNGTGRPERVGRAGGCDCTARMTVDLDFRGAEDEFVRLMRRAIRVRGGNVQQVLGRG